MPLFTQPYTNRRYLDAVTDHVVLFDGATGTELAKIPLTIEDYGGKRTEGLLEMLLLHRPEAVAQVHASYLAAGAEVIETDSFRANRLTLEDFGVGEMTETLNRLAAETARREADRAAAETGIPRFVAGSMGPTGKLISLDDPELSDVSFAALADIYAEQARGLLLGGVDVLLLETQQDLLELKAAIHGIWHTFQELHMRVPIQAQVTLDTSGHMLTGADVDTALVTLAALPVEIIGLNCSTGPEEMRASVRRLVARSNRPVSVLPNAGMPENIGGRAVYRLQPEPFAEAMTTFASWGVRIVGGCCGTGPEHIARLHEMLSQTGLRPLDEQGHPIPTNPPRPFEFPAPPLPAVSGGLSEVPLHQEPRPLIVGERINTQGSRKAKRLVMNHRYDALLELAEQQVAYGAHVLDVCVALTERADEVETMQRVVKLLSLNTPAPLMLDTTDEVVMRAAMETYPGRAILNSVHLEAGETRARRIMSLAREFGAALVALTIDEQGMAKTAAHKLAVAQRLYRMAVDEIGLPPHALIFDPLTFTLATGDAETANAANETLEALRRIKETLPGTLTNLGVSNVSFGLNPAARRVLNSVFLYRAVEAGLDLAIVNPAQITPYAELSAELRTLAEDLLFNRSPDALARYIAHFEDVTLEDQAASTFATLPPREQLYQAILQRRREGVEARVDACLAEMTPINVLNEVLLPAMKEVGVRFGNGELILPFVLKSAEVMKAAVAHLEQFMERNADVSKGTVVLATVFGDVHDIGKNLVKTILVNNGYAVHDLGKQVPAQAIVDHAVAVHADAIGLSALLVATSQQMQLVVEELHRRGLSIPVLVGGAAINPKFALRIAMTGGELYHGGVYYCEDAFEALQVLEHIILQPRQQPPEEHQHNEPAVERPAAPQAPPKVTVIVQQPEIPSSDEAAGACATCGACSASVDSIANTVLKALIPKPPFWGPQVIKGIPLRDLWPLLDRKSLYRVGWGARGATGEKWEALRQEFDARLEAMWATADDYLHPRAVYGYFPAQSVGNDLILYDPVGFQAGEPLSEVGRFTFPRQPKGKQLCLADYFASAGSGVVDVAVLQVVTVGSSATKRSQQLERAGQYSEAYFIHGLAAQAAEATAEWLHRRIRRELKLADNQGKRYSWGYPACPDLAGHQVVFALLPVTSALGVTLTPANQLTPEHSTAALVMHHPRAKYFGVRRA